MAINGTAQNDTINTLEKNVIYGDADNDTAVCNRIVSGAEYDRLYITNLVA